MNRQKCKTLSAAAEKALQAVAAEHGVSIKYKGGSFARASAALKFEFSEVAEDGTVQTPEMEDFTTYAYRYGLEADDLGRSFNSHGKVFTICGLKPRATKMPIIAESGGKMYKFPAASVKLALAG